MVFPSYLKIFQTMFIAENPVKKAGLSEQGFTLIELLVAVTTMVLLVGLGIPAYLKFNKRQRIRGAKNQIETMIEMAVQKAQGELGPCDRLYGYEIKAVNSGTEVKMRPVCLAGSTPTWGSVDVHHQFTTGVYLLDAESLAFQFRSINSEVIYVGDHASSAWLSAASPWEIRLTDGNRVYSFNLTQEGTISEGSWL